MREQSDISGPKPILLENFDEDDLMALMVGGRSQVSRNP